jgi:hypothetical protein
MNLYNTAQSVSRLWLKDLLPQLLQPPEIVMLYVPSGLVEFDGDLFKAVALEQMKPQGLTLDLGEDSTHLA